MFLNGLFGMIAMSYMSDKQLETLPYNIGSIFKLLIYVYLFYHLNGTKGVQKLSTLSKLRNNVFIKK